MKVHEDKYVVYIPTLVVLPYNTIICYPKLNLITFAIVERPDTTLRSSQLPSGLSAGPMFK